MWSPAPSVGVPELDRQHGELFARVDTLLAAARDGRSTEEIGRLLGFLGDYVVQHFAGEEALMAERGYPERAAHRAEHQQFRGRLEALVKEYLENGATVLLVVKVNGFVGAWLRDHIHRSDRAFARHLAQAPLFKSIA